MATVYIDRLTTLAAVEDRGAVIQLTRQALVVGLAETDFDVIFEALDEAGVPAAGSTPTGYDNLVLVKRSPTLVPGEQSKVLVTLEYVSKRDAGYAFTFSGGTALKQITTQVSGNGSPLTVQHTWPGDDNDWPSETHTQGSECQVYLPETEMHATGLMDTDYPQRISSLWTGCVNDSPWAFGRAGYFIVSNVTWNPHDMSTSPRKWEFTFTFQYDRTGWQPVYSFIDPRTGRAPANLVDNVGRKTLLWYPSADYNTLFAV